MRACVRSRGTCVCVCELISVGSIRAVLGSHVNEQRQEHCNGSSGASPGIRHTNNKLHLCERERAPATDQRNNEIRIKKNLEPLMWGLFSHTLVILCWVCSRVSSCGGNERRFAYDARAQQQYANLKCRRPSEMRCECAIALIRLWVALGRARNRVWRQRR